MNDRSQIDKLAGFIMRNVPGEPNQDSGAGDCAIRIIIKLQGELAEVDRLLSNRAALDDVKGRANKISKTIATASKAPDERQEG